MEEVNDAAKQIISKAGPKLWSFLLVPRCGLQPKILMIMFLHLMLLKKSTWARDSMVGGMVWALRKKKNLKEVIRWGVACGSAATMNEGTLKINLEDAKRLFEWLKDNKIKKLMTILHRQVSQYCISLG
jgi:6-phosphofructokinase 2